MVNFIITTILSAFAMLAALPVALAADTLADMDIQISPELLAMGIDPGVKHERAGEQPLTAQAPQFIRNEIGPVVYIGDSIIAFLPAGMLPAGAINLAVSGNMTPQILASVAQIPRNASRVIIEGGINDMLNPNIPTNTVSNYAAILAAIPKGAKVEVVGILPINEALIKPAFVGFISNSAISATDGQIATACRCTLVPVPPISTVDGIHPTPAGQAILAKAIH